MESVFNEYRVCDDVRDIISRKVHEKNQEEINRHISVIIGWDEEYDYWNFFGEIVSTKYLIERGNQNDTWFYTLSVIEKEKLLETPTSQKDWIEHKLDYISCYDRQYNTKKISNKLPTEQYMKYIFSNKRIFSMNSFIRFRHIRDYIFGRVLYYSSYKFIESSPQAREHFLGTSDLENGFNNFNRNLKYYNNRIFCKYMKKLNKNEKKFHEQNKFDDIIDPLKYRIYYPFSKKIKKQHLIIYLMQNRYPKNMDKKNKKKLWRIIMKLK
jgi:hypothetical protein